jgi:D-alanine transfer protein
MTNRSFVPMILAFFTFLLIILMPSEWIIPVIPKSRIPQAATQLNPLMMQGKFIQSKMLEDPKYFPIYGSSELLRLDRFHPSNYFEVNKPGFTPFLVGRGGSQSIIHFLNFASQADHLKGRKLVFIISPQWFVRGGIDEARFAPNFSTLQGYNLAFNNKISPKLKKKAMQRLLHFKEVNNDFMLKTLYEAEVSNSPMIKQRAMIITPIAKVYNNTLKKKDLYYSLAGGIPRSREISPKVKGKTWQQLIKMANIMGENQAHNPLHIVDSKYKKVSHKLHKYKNSKKQSSFGHSIEYSDFQLLLDVLKESDAKAMFVVIPVNGKWYDFTGFSKEGRKSFYNRIKKQIDQEGYTIIDYSDHEYDPYFLKDTMHIGWKGWVYLDRDMLKFFHKY